MTANRFSWENISDLLTPTIPYLSGRLKPYSN